MMMKFRRIAQTGSAFALAALIAAPALAQPGGRVAERRAMMEQRLQQMDRGQMTERVAQRQDRRDGIQRDSDQVVLRQERREDVFTAMSEATPEGVQARLDDREEIMLTRLAEADPEAISDIVSQAGAAAGERLENAPGAYLSQDQIDQLIAAAALAEGVTPQQVELLLAAGALQVEDFFDTRDAEYIAETFNAIGEKALEL